MPTHPAILIAQAFADGFSVDCASWQAGYAGASECPAGLDRFSFYLGRAERRRFTPKEGR